VIAGRSCKTTRHSGTRAAAEQGDALLQGAAPSSLDRALLPRVVLYLRARQAERLARAPPDYPTAQRCDEACWRLLLLIAQGAHCTAQRVILLWNVSPSPPPSSILHSLARF
jgi:hypothetical protein